MNADRHKIRPCPFCAMSASLVGYTGRCRVVCDDPDGCGARGPLRDDQQTALVAWNDRHTDVIRNDLVRLTSQIVERLRGVECSCGECVPCSARLILAALVAE